MTWNTVPLGEVVERVGRAGPDPRGRTFSYVDLSSIDAASKTITTATDLLSEDAPSRARQNLIAGDVLVSTVRPNLNGVAVVPASLDGAVGSTGFSVLRARFAALDPRYLFHWVRTPAFIDNMTRRSTGASYPAVTDAVVKASPIPLPPLPEQSRIAAILDEADALRSTWGKTRESSRRAITSRVSALLSKPTGIKPLADLLAEPMRNGISPSRGGRYEGEVLTLSAITRGAFDPRQRKSDVFAAPHAADKLATEGLHLICRGNGNAELVGAMAAVTDELDGVAFPDTMIGFRPSSEINSPTLVAAWRHPTVRDQLRRAARTTNGTYKVNQQSLAAVMVPVPRREDQEKIGSLDAEGAKLDSQLAQGLVSLGDLFASLQHRAFRGDL